MKDLLQKDSCCQARLHIDWHLINLHQFVGVVLDEQRVGIPLRNTSNGYDFAKPLIFCLVGKTPKPILISIVMAEIERC